VYARARAREREREREREEKGKAFGEHGTMFFALTGCVVPNSKFRNYWDFIVILLVIYTSLVLPVRTAFLWAEEEAVTDTGEIDSSMDGWTVMDLVIDFTFLFDVILNFNTGFIREPDFVSRRSLRHHLTTLTMRQSG
jgi:hypothetical protein